MRFFFFIMKEINIQKLTAQEIAELDASAAMRKLEENCNLLIEVDKALFDALSELGKWRIEVEKLKAMKNTLIETNRALKVVVQNG